MENERHVSGGKRGNGFLSAMRKFLTVKMTPPLPLLQVLHKTMQFFSPLSHGVLVVKRNKLTNVLQIARVTWNKSLDCIIYESFIHHTWQFKIRKKITKQTK